MGKFWGCLGFSFSNQSQLRTIFGENTPQLAQSFYLSSFYLQLFLFMKVPQVLSHFCFMPAHLCQHSSSESPDLFSSTYTMADSDPAKTKAATSGQEQTSFTRCSGRGDGAASTCWEGCGCTTVLRLQEHMEMGLALNSMLCLKGNCCQPHLEQRFPAC